LVQADPTLASSERPPSRGGLWVLFVDDDPLVLKSCRRALGEQFQIQTASSAAEALGLIDAAAPPAVVVADQQMPGMNGIDFLINLRSMVPDAVRIMLTGQADLSTAMQAVNLGQVFRFLTKPVDVPTLREVVTAAVQVYVERMDEIHLLEEAMANRQADGSDAESTALKRLLDAKLTPRELEVLGLIGLGGTSKDIGPQLGISHRTVDVHRNHILMKLELHNSTSLVHVAIKAGLA